MVKVYHVTEKENRIIPKTRNELMSSALSDYLKKYLVDNRVANDLAVLLHKDMDKLIYTGDCSVVGINNHPVRFISYRDNEIIIRYDRNNYGNVRTITQKVIGNGNISYESSDSEIYSPSNVPNEVCNSAEEKRIICNKDREVLFEESNSISHDFYDEESSPLYKGDILLEKKMYWHFPNGSILCYSLRRSLLDDRISYEYYSFCKGAIVDDFQTEYNFKEIDKETFENILKHESIMDVTKADYGKVDSFLKRSRFL